MLVGLFGVPGCASESADRSAVTIQKNTKGYLFTEDGDSILVYSIFPMSPLPTGRTHAAITSTFFTALDGTVLTEDFPADHPHQHGIFWAWHQVYVGDERVGDGWTQEDVDWQVQEIESNRRWIVGMKWGLLTNQFGLLVAWDCSTANVHDTKFQPLVEAFEEEMVVMSDLGFHAAEDDPANLKLCEPKTWSGRMVIETVFSMLTRLCHFKRMTCRTWTYFKARLSFAVAAFNTLVQWHGFESNENSFLKLSMVEFSL